MRNQGFTLIELLVAITLLFLLMGGGIVGYIRFNERQRFIQAHEMVRETLELTQVKARSGKLEGCDVLTAYKIVLYNISSSGMISIAPECFAGISASTDYSLPPRVFFTSPNQVFYIHAISGVFDNNTIVGDSDPDFIDFELQGGQQTALMQFSRYGFVAVDEEVVTPVVSPTTSPLPSITPEAAPHNPCFDQCFENPPDCSPGVSECMPSQSGCAWVCVDYSDF